jgi:ribonuclease HII
MSQEIMPMKETKETIGLLPFYNGDLETMEIGVDEAGRGPLFGRVYSAAVILPKDDSFQHSLMKDSKKFHSKKKILEAYEYIKENAVAWSVAFSDEKVIDQINILQATQQAMHQAIGEVETKICHEMSSAEKKALLILADGNYFKPFTRYNKEKQRIESIPHVCVTGGDNKYSAIAAASILAKVERDKYIEDLCGEHPDLVEKYDLAKNKGYGTKKHMAGIKEHGITEWHRTSFNLFKNATF